MSIEMTSPRQGRPEHIGSGRLPASARLGTVRLQVGDLARSEAFYTGVLGLRAAHHGGGRLLLTAGESREPLVELIERPSAQALRPRSRLGLFHYALLVPDRPSLADFALHAERNRIRLGMSDHLVSEALYLHDPDGLGIEVYADRPRTEWRSRGGQWIMATEPLDVDGLLAESGGEPYTGLPTGTVVGHVHLHVGDLGEAARFYNETLGFDEVVRDYPGALFFSAGGYHHHVGTNVWASGAPSPGEDDARLMSWTLLLPEEADLTRISDAARANDRSVTERGPLGGLLLSDPWGTRVEVLAGARAATALREGLPIVAANRRNP
jgi:catechol 2,3-dioxygenase